MSKLSVFFDSGAYSAWSQGAEINLEEYADYIRANIEEIEVYANLDCIPGTRGKAATAKEKEDAAQKSWDNYLWLRGEGFNPLPVYHYGESRKWLDKMLDYGCDYIGLGGLVKKPAPDQRKWLDSVFSDICDKDGLPIVKTHGFGITNLAFLFRYPWHSVDSTSWHIYVRYGWVTVPRVNKDGVLLFDQPPMLISPSSDPRAIRYAKSKHLIRQSPLIKQALYDWLEMCEVTLEEVSESSQARAKCVVRFFQEISKLKETKPTRFHAPRRRGILT